MSNNSYSVVYLNTELRLIHECTNEREAHRRCAELNIERAGDYVFVQHWIYLGETLDEHFHRLFFKQTPYYTDYDSKSRIIEYYEFEGNQYKGVYSLSNEDAYCYYILVN